MPRALLLGAVIACAGAGLAHAAVSQTIYADIDADGNIHVSFADGTPIGSTVPPGTYTFVLNNNGLDDLGNPHLFHLVGPGVNVVGTPNVQTTSTVTFQSGGTYTYQDDDNPSTTKHTFVATTAAPAPAAPTTSTAPITASKPTSVGIVGSGIIPFRGSLDAIVYASGKLSLSRNGNKVDFLTTGRYTFAVDDESHKAGFVVQLLHHAADTLTSRKFVGSQNTTVTLVAGRWFFYSPGGRKSTFFVRS